MKMMRVSLVIVALGGVLAMSGCPGSGLDSGNLSAPVPGYNYFLYVVNQGFNMLHGHPIDTSSGAIGAAGPNVTTAGGNSTIAVDPKGRFVYSSVSGSGIAAFKITSSTTGALEASGSPFGGNGAFWMTVDPQGKYGYYTDETANTVVSVTIDQTTGALTANGAGVSTGVTSNPAEVIVTPNGKFAYVTTFSGNLEAFSISPSNGQLSAVGSPITGLAGPYFMAVTPNNKFLYVVQQSLTTGILSIFSIGADGSLTGAGSKTQPTNTVLQQISIDQTGQFLYGAEVNNAGVLSYAIDANSGALTQIGSEISVSILNPDSLVIAPNNFVIVVGANGQAAGHSLAAVFSINPGTGALTAVTGSPFDVCFTAAFGAVAAVPQ